jgi:hypothetical protein
MAKKHDAATKDAEAFVRHALSHRTNSKVSNAAVRAAAEKISKRLSDTLSVFSAGERAPTTNGVD